MPKDKEEEECNGYVTNNCSPSENTENFVGKLGNRKYKMELIPGIFRNWDPAFKPYPERLLVKMLMAMTIIKA